MIPRALNQKTARHLSWEGFLDLAQRLGCVGVEPRDDLGRPFFDGLDPREAARMARGRGLRLLGLSEVYGINVWDRERAAQVAALIEVAEAAGAETISLIPSVDDRPVVPLREALREVREMLAGRRLVALVEPIGFASSSLRRKAEAVEAIEAVGGSSCFGIVHDTFQHQIAGELQVFAPWTRMVHISGISAPDVPLDASQDPHRVLVDAQDRCGTLEQIAALRAAGYEGAFSFECTDASVQESGALQQEVAASFAYIDSALC
ncbi:sugar epimerase [Salipiger sp. CCB-MM3]|uniref:TIM barrel protein n=1 Tax=Salipiger sp. CCB-MM3 TaxID=1792508 RepID=UPI00080AAF13|nr:TIM barrel protein [Salipiger sp. CCB-MM3]ANT62695.1 sugar epimerase [Salipiger sp. CCB-MM3]